MSSEEVGAMVFAVGYGALLLGAIRVFGLRRVLRGFGLFIFFAVAVALRTLGAVTGYRR